MGWMKIGAVCCTVLLAAGQSACTVPAEKPQSVQLVASTATSGVAVTPSKLAGTSWTAFFIDGVAEVLSPKPKLRWDLSQRVSGTGGCNSFVGASVVGADSLRLGSLAATGKPCVTLPGAQEDMFYKSLELTRKARLDGEQLVLLDANGNPLVRLLPGN